MGKVQINNNIVTIRVSTEHQMEGLARTVREWVARGITCIVIENRIPYAHEDEKIMGTEYCRRVLQEIMTYS